MLYFHTTTDCAATVTSTLTRAYDGNRPLTLADLASTMDDLAAAKAARTRTTDEVFADFLDDEITDLYTEAARTRRAFAAA